jgi:hypothetical protein
MTTMPMVVLVHSPLVGPLTWLPAAERLRLAGYRVAVPSLAGVFHASPPYYRTLAGKVVEAIGQPDPTQAVILAGHSGAGALLPAVIEATTTPVTAAVFVDAILPHPGTSWFDSAPAALGEQLRGLARDGRLPPWHQWFPPEAVNQLLPQESLRRRFIAELPRVPLAYLEEVAPLVPGWPPASCGYLQLSAAYAEAAGAAARRGWLVVHEPTDHLAMLTRPAVIAGVVDRLVKTLIRAEPDAPTIRQRDDQARS